MDWYFSILLNSLRGNRKILSLYSAKCESQRESRTHLLSVFITVFWFLMWFCLHILVFVGKTDKKPNTEQNDKYWNMYFRSSNKTTTGFPFTIKQLTSPLDSGLYAKAEYSLLASLGDGRAANEHWSQNLKSARQMEECYTKYIERQRRRWRQRPQKPPIH